MEHEPEESPAGVEPAEDDDDDSRKAAGWIAGTTGAAVLGGTVVGGIAASGSPPSAVHTTGAEHGPGVHGDPLSQPPAGGSGPGIHGDPLGQPPAGGSGPGIHGDPLGQPPAGGSGPGLHGDPFTQPAGSTPIVPVAGEPDDLPIGLRTNRWVMIVAGAIVAAAVVVGVVLLTGGDDDPSNSAGSPAQAEPAVTDPSPTEPGGTTGAPLTAPEVAGSTVPLIPIDGGTLTFVVTGGLEQSAEFALMSTVPADGGLLLNYANPAGDQVLQVGVLPDQTIISYTGGGGIVAGDSDTGCTFDLTYDGDVLVAGTFVCVGIPGVVGGSSPITADISGSFDTGQ